MQVLLLQDVERLGQAGEVKRVADGYARNYLFPRELAVLATPGAIKQAEKQESEGRASRLDGVPKSLPALSQAFSYQDRAARVRFDWPVIEPVIAKVHEEIAEIHAAETAEAPAEGEETKADA